MAVIQLGAVQKPANDFALRLGVVEDDHGSGQFDEEPAEGGAGVVPHPVDFLDVGQAQFVAHILGHAPACLADQQVHQLEGFGSRRVLDVDPPRHLCGQNCLGFIEGAIRRNLGGSLHGDKLSRYFVTCQRAISSPFVTQ